MGSNPNFLMSTAWVRLPLERLLFTINSRAAGGVAERFKAPVLKTGVHFVDREFESRPLRQLRYWFTGYWFSVSPMLKFPGNLSLRTSNE